MVEHLGSGIPRILEGYSRDCFYFSENFLRIFFPASETIYAQSNDGGAIGGAIEGLTNRQKEVLQLIQQNIRIAYREAAEQLNINNSAAQTHFEALKEKGFIERVSGTRGYWKILIDT